MHFRDIRVRKLPSASWKGGGPCRAGSSEFAVVKAAAVDKWMLVEPLYAPGFSEIARHGLVDTCYQDLASGLYAAGYQPTLVDGYDVGERTFLNVVYRPGLPQRPSFHGLTGSQYQEKFDELRAAGAHPVFVESYLRGGQVRYAIIAEKSGGPAFVAWHGATQAQHQTGFDLYKAQGYTPTAISVVSVGGKLSYAALMEKRDLGSWMAKSQLTAAEYQAFAEDNEEAGRHLVYVNAYVHEGKTRFVAIASSKASGSYAARHGLSSKGYQEQWETWTGKGFGTRSIAGYAAGGSHTFAAIWR